MLCRALRRIRGPAVEAEPHNGLQRPAPTRQRAQPASLKVYTKLPPRRRRRAQVDDDPSYEDVLDSGIDYKKDASGRVTPAVPPARKATSETRTPRRIVGVSSETQPTRRPAQAMTVGEGMALKDVIAPELWKDFGLDENGDPIQ